MSSAFHITLGEPPAVQEIQDVAAAAEWLSDRWPEAHRGTLKHLAAQVACADLIESGGDAAIAQDAFMAAAEEAGLLSSQ